MPDIRQVHVAISLSLIQTLMYIMIIFQYLMIEQ